MLKMPSILRSIKHLGANKYTIDSMPTIHILCICILCICVYYVCVYSMHMYTVCMYIYYICIYDVYVYSMPTISNDEELFYSYFKIQL